MQDSLPAAGPALPGGIGYPQGSCERFHGCNDPPFPSFLRDVSSSFWGNPVSVHHSRGNPGRVDLGGCPPKCRVAREHCCSPAPSERHVNLSVYAAQASPKAPRGTRWGVTHHLHDTGLGLTGVTRRRPHQQQAAVICSVSQASCSDGLVRRHPREVSPLSRGMISPGGSTPIRSITGRHSLPPSSSTRRPIGNPLAEGLPREEDDGLTTFHG